MAEKEKKSNAGQPPKYSTPQAMQEAIDLYFDDCPDKRKIPVGDTFAEIPCPTISGLAMHLGFCDRRSMYDYEKRPEYSHTIKSARNRMAKEYEMDLRFGRNQSGAIFALKNFGWTDSATINHSGKVDSNITVGPPVLNFKEKKVPTDDELEQILEDREDQEKANNDQT